MRVQALWICWKWPPPALTHTAPIQIWRSEGTGAFVLVFLQCPDCWWWLSQARFYAYFYLFEWLRSPCLKVKNKPFLSVWKNRPAVYEYNCPQSDFNVGNWNWTTSSGLCNTCADCLSWLCPSHVNGEFIFRTHFFRCIYRKQIIMVCTAYSTCSQKEVLHISPQQSPEHHDSCC